MKANIDLANFSKDMTNIIKYSEGFLEGAQRAKGKLLANIGKHAVEAIKEFIDASARMDPRMLHHVYEWNQVGSPNARLFDIDYNVNGSGLSIGGTFRQSTIVKPGSTTPFYDKARIMEEGIPVRIRPVNKKALAFNDDGEEVVIAGEVTVMEPGGPDVQGSFEKTLDLFMTRYFSQSFLESSGIKQYLKDTKVFKRNLTAGKNRGRAHGVSVGYRWMARAGVN